MSWPLVKFSDLIGPSGVFTDGDWVESKDQDPQGDVRLIQLADVGVAEFINKSNRFMTSAKANELKCTFLEAGDILIARMPDPIGRACIFPDAMGKCVTVVDVCVVRPNHKAVFSRWLMHLINSEKFKDQIEKHVTGTTRQRISRGNLAQLEVPLPPLEEQKRIAAILDKADAIRRKRQQAIKLADDFLRSVFLEMFGDPVTNPKGWPVGTIRDLVESANYGSSAKASSTEGEYPMLRMGNITYEGAIDLTDLKYVDLDENDKPKYLASKGDLLFNRTNSKELVGKTAVYDRDNPVAIAGYLIRVRTNLMGNTHYISGYLNSVHGKTTLQNMCKSIVGMANINAQEMQNIPIVLPPIEVQEKYKEIVVATKEKLKKLDFSLEHISSLFNSLSQKAFSGTL